MAGAFFLLLPRVPPIPALTRRWALFSFGSHVRYPKKRAGPPGVLCRAVLAVNDLGQTHGRSSTLVWHLLKCPYPLYRMSRSGFRLLQSRYATTKVLVSTTMALLQAAPGSEGFFPGILSSSPFIHFSLIYPFRHSRYNGLEERQRDHRG